MTLSTSHHIREQFEHCLAVIRHASVEILLLLNVHASEGKDPRWFLEQLDSARLALGGWGAVAKKLNLNDAEMSEFTLQLRLLQQRVPQYESGQDVSENQLIAAMRFVTALEQNTDRHKRNHTRNTVQNGRYCCYGEPDRFEIQIDRSLFFHISYHE